MREHKQPIERYLRSDTTILARGLKLISPEEGEPYRNSGVKRMIDIAFSFPLAAAALPVVLALAIGRKIEDGQPAFFVQDRLGKNGQTFPMIKMNAMRANVDNSANTNIAAGVNFKPEDDTRNTRLGRFMQKYDFVEMPQLFQTFLGEMSLIGIRAAPQYVFDYLTQIRPKCYQAWEQAYFSGKPGLISLNSSFNESPKNDAKRHHFDMLYAKKANLGLDLLIVYKTATKLLRRVRVISITSTQ